MFNFEKLKAGISPGLQWIIIVFLAVTIPIFGMPILLRKLNDMKTDHTRASLALMFTGLAFAMLGMLLLLGSILESVDPAGSQFVDYRDTLYFLVSGLYLAAIGLFFFLKHSQLRRLRSLIMGKEIDDLTLLAELLNVSERHLAAEILVLIHNQVLTGIRLSLQEKKIIRASYEAALPFRKEKNTSLLRGLIYSGIGFLTLVNPVSYFPCIVLLCLGLIMLKYRSKPDIHDRLAFFGVFLLGQSIQVNCLIRSDIYFSNALTSPEIHPVNATFASFLVFLICAASAYLLKRRAEKQLILDQLKQEKQAASEQDLPGFNPAS